MLVDDDMKACNADNSNDNDYSTRRVVDLAYVNGQQYTAVIFI